MFIDARRETSAKKGRARLIMNHSPWYLVKDNKVKDTSSHSPVSANSKAGINDQMMTNKMLQTN
jgi:hypothetical protein